MLRDSDADVIALQELSDDAAHHIENELSALYPHMALHPRPFGYYGMGLLSRHPITDSAYFDDPNTLGTQRAVINFTSPTQATEIIVHNVHPVVPLGNGAVFNPSRRSIGLDHILARIDSEPQDTPMLVLGDFNMPDLSDDYARLSERFTDVYHQMGSGFGYTYMPYVRDLQRRLPPLLRLDYIFTTKHFMPLAAWVKTDSGGSDHRPVLAHLYFAPNNH